MIGALLLLDKQAYFCTHKSFACPSNLYITNHRSHSLSPTVAHPNLYDTYLSSKQHNRVAGIQTGISLHSKLKRKQQGWTQAGISKPTQSLMMQAQLNALHAEITVAAISASNDASRAVLHHSHSKKSLLSHKYTTLHASVRFSASYSPLQSSASVFSS